jgi:hypothetical protein
VIKFVSEYTGEPFACGSNTHPTANTLLQQLSTRPAFAPSQSTNVDKGECGLYSIHCACYEKLRLFVDFTGRAKELLGVI